MKKGLTILAVALSAFFLAVPFSHAFDDETLLAKLVIEDDQGAREGSDSRETSVPSYPSYEDYSFEDVNPVLYEAKTDGGARRDWKRSDVNFKNDRIAGMLLYRGPVTSTGGGSEKLFKSRIPDMEFSSMIGGLSRGELPQVGLALATSFLLHELGHVVVADYVGARGVNLDFFTSRNGNFFIGHASYESMNRGSELPFSMAGEFAADMTFEYALQSYRKEPTLYNKSLLFFSGTDFLRYCAYSFYMTEGDGHYDPVAVSRETGISRDMIFSLALAKTAVNAYRVYSGNDWAIPYFTVDRYSATFNVQVNF
ncbi:MAG TPA: hypothetical protein VJM57_06740 [Thermodesulfobacteriota bacterium]|nr:hypothetical protein [Thermodesulfobacteriota bacterium]